jgi:hypothetical protein
LPENLPENPLRYIAILEISTKTPTIGAFQSLILVSWKNGNSSPTTLITKIRHKLRKGEILDLNALGFGDFS